MRPMDKGVAKAFVLKTLMDGPAHGYEIMKKIEEVTGFIPSPGHIYMLLKKLEREKLVDVSVSYTGGRKVKIYKLSDEGRRFLENNRDLLKYVDVCVERFRKAKEIELHKLLETTRNIFESLDKLTNDEVKLVKETICNFIKKIDEIIGG